MDYSTIPSSPSHPNPPASPPPPGPSKQSIRLLALSLAAILLLGLISLLSDLQHDNEPPNLDPVPDPCLSSSISSHLSVSRGRSLGVSEKGTGPRLGSSSSSCSFPWTNTMLQWQRTAFHFQPSKNWMNDPNGPLFYKGWYHLFYQYNPSSAVWGNITWGHAVSRDLVHWLHLPLAMVPDRWYDVNGVWTGSATTLPDGSLVMIYTGSTNASVQVQNLAVPADPNDPLLLHWKKHDSNPVLVPPPGVGPLDFRDPTTAWFDPAEKAWRFVIGTKEDNQHSGIVLVYRTRDFLSYELLPGIMHAVPRTGMWECVDFYPVAIAPDANGMDTSAAPGEGVKHVLKASMDDDRHDYYAIGTYDRKSGEWTPDDPAADVGIGLRYDWGIFYASKTFYDPKKKRRVLWGWIGETDSEVADVEKGWASLQGTPRTVLYDPKTGSNLLQWPVEEVESLRSRSREFANISVSAGSVVPLGISGHSSAQLDIEAEFQVDVVALDEAPQPEAKYACTSSGGAAARGLLGPFGLLVLADPRQSEQTAVYFYISKSAAGGLQTHFCHDETKSSKANDIYKKVVGNTVPVLVGEKLKVRILVDHSIIESFAQGGRTCITSRVYPTVAINNSASVYLFNNATQGHVTATWVKIWEMNSADIRPFPFPN